MLTFGCVISETRHKNYAQYLGVIDGLGFLIRRDTRRNTGRSPTTAPTPTFRRPSGRRKRARDDGRTDGRRPTANLDSERRGPCAMKRPG